MSKFIKKNEEYLKIDNKFKYFIFLCFLYLLIPISYLIYRRKNNWLVCERGNDAQDNGYFFYKYLRENHPEINAVYLIKKSSRFYEKVANLGKCVEFGSLKHKLMMIAFPVKISSHLFGYSCYKNYTLYLRRHKTRDVHVFLQHGIIKNDHPGLYGNVTNLDLFVCGAKPEFEAIKNGFMYYKDEVQYTGFARYDDLGNSFAKQQILFMPTWRRELVGLSDDEFRKTDFFINWDNLLHSEKLLKICREKSLKIKFYPHYSLQKYSHLFSGSDVVQIVNFNDEEVHDLLKESLMLVTDFSSVYFDMAYLNRPIVFFQFDEEAYFKNHYEKGYFDYRESGFGPVCNLLDEANSNILRLIEHNFELDEKTLISFNSYFIFKDSNNCERIFERINTIINK